MKEAIQDKELTAFAGSYCDPYKHAEVESYGRDIVILHPLTENPLTKETISIEAALKNAFNTLKQERKSYPYAIYLPTFNSPEAIRALSEQIRDLHSFETKCIIIGANTKDALESLNFPTDIKSLLFTQSAKTEIESNPELMATLVEKISHVNGGVFHTNISCENHPDLQRKLDSVLKGNCIASSDTNKHNVKSRITDVESSLKRYSLGMTTDDNKYTKALESSRAKLISQL